MIGFPTESRLRHAENVRDFPRKTANERLAKSGRRLRLVTNRHGNLKQMDAATNKKQAHAGISRLKSA